MEKLLKKLIFASLYSKATEDDIIALDENTKKHAQVLLQSLIVLPGSVIAAKYGSDTTQLIVGAVAIAAQIAGLAWFVITNAALPKRHKTGAMVITKTMFTSFVSGIYALVTLAAFSAPLSLPVILPIYGFLYVAAAVYDSADLLKVGMDEETMEASKATRRIELMLRRMLELMENTARAATEPTD